MKLMVTGRFDEEARLLGFKDDQERFDMISRLDLIDPAIREAFSDWRDIDGRKSTLIILMESSRKGKASEDLPKTPAPFELVAIHEYVPSVHEYVPPSVDIYHVGFWDGRQWRVLSGEAEDGTPLSPGCWQGATIANIAEWCPIWMVDRRSKAQDLESRSPGLEKQITHLTKRLEHLEDHYSGHHHHDGDPTPWVTKKNDGFSNRQDGPDTVLVPFRKYADNTR